MALLLAIVIVASCVAAAVRRLHGVVAPSALDAATLAGVARRGGGERVRRALAGAAEGTWEVALHEALSAPASTRAAYVNEQLTELDGMLSRWARVPRVCASVATSAGFLLATMALRDGLTRGASADEVVFRALDVGAVGLCGAAFCIAVQGRARGVVRARRDAADALVERLENADVPLEPQVGVDSPAPVRLPSNSGNTPEDRRL